MSRRGHDADTADGKSVVAAQLLGHADTTITMEAYIKHDRTALISGMKKLSKKLKK